MRSASVWGGHEFLNLSEKHRREKWLGMNSCHAKAKYQVCRAEL